MSISVWFYKCILIVIYMYIDRLTTSASPLASLACSRLTIFSSRQNVLVGQHFITVSCKKEAIESIRNIRYA